MVLATRCTVVSAYPGYEGPGPGAITPDGRVVELYSRLPPETSRTSSPPQHPRAPILELGCGVRRVTYPLLERGFTVTAADESQEMLDRVHGARTVHSPIEDLE